MQGSSSGDGDSETLEEEMRRKRYSYPEVLEIMFELSALVAELQRREPPDSYGELNVSNVLRRREDQRLVLRKIGELTNPQSDIYALGVVCVVLLTNQPEAALTDARGQLQWRVHVNDPTLEALVGEMLDLDLGRRLNDAGEAARRFAEMRGGPTTVSSVGEQVNSVLELFIPEVLLPFESESQLPPANLNMTLGAATPLVSEAAHAPPAAPRTLPDNFAERAAGKANMMRSLGISLALLSLFVLGTLRESVPVVIACALIIVGCIVVTVLGFKQVARAAAIYRAGLVAPGVITQAHLQVSMGSQTREAYTLRFRYEVDGKPFEASTARFDPPTELRKQGANVFVICDPTDPERAFLWPL